VLDQHNQYIYDREVATMKTEKRVREDARQKETDALVRILGPAGAVKFLQQLGRSTSNGAEDQARQAKAHIPTLVHKSKTRYLKQP
jgi:hypothetical protein